MPAVLGTKGLGRAPATGGVTPPRAETGNSHAKRGSLPLLVGADGRIIVKLSWSAKETRNDQL